MATDSTVPIAAPSGSLPDAPVDAAAERTHRLRVIAIATATLATIAGILALHLAREFLVPIALALVLAALLQPVVTLLRRARLPAPVAAVIAILGTLALLIAIGMALNQPVRDLTKELPQNIDKARGKIVQLLAPLQRMQRRVQAGPAAAPAAKAPAAPAPAPATPAPPASSATETAGKAAGFSASILATTVEVLLLALLVLAGGDAWREKAQDTAPSRRALRSTLVAARDMRAVVSRYLFVTVLINIGQGVLVGLVTWWLDFPSPLLWGAITFLAEFIPYIGGLCVIVLLAVVGLATGDGGSRALLAPAAYLLITTLQNNLVSPVAYGRGLRLNPAMILVGVMFWWMVWGIAGVFLAVPLLACLRILGDHVKAVEPLSVFLSD